MRGCSIPRRGLLAVFLVLAFQFSDGMEWPGTDAVTDFNFAWNQSGRPTLGYGFRTQGPVRSVNSGQIIFSRDESDTGLPSPLGVWIAIDHGDGLIGVYGHLNRISTGALHTVAEGDIVGFSGNSGYAKDDGFYFSFYDRKEKRWVNPGMILPLKSHNRLPVVRSIFLQNETGQRFNLSQTRIFTQGTYRILVDAVEAQLSANDTPLAPHRLVCSVNGQETGSLAFETLGVRQGTLLVSTRNSLIEAGPVFASYPSLDLGEVSLNRGQAAIEIIIQDLSGNSRDLNFRLVVE